jgi:hypothetical protein
MGANMSGPPVDHRAYGRTVEEALNGITCLVRYHYGPIVCIKRQKVNLKWHTEGLSFGIVSGEASCHTSTTLARGMPCRSCAR